MIVWADQAGFYMLPTVRKTYAPQGETPCLRAPLNYGGLSCMSAVSEKGHLVTQTIKGAFNGVKVVRFLKHLLRQIPGKLLVIWDGASIHRCKEVKAFLKEGGSKRLWLERLPTAAPDLNPDEGVWGWLKNDMANLCCLNLKELRTFLRRSIRRLRNKTDLIFSFIRRSKLDLDL